MTEIFKSSLGNPSISEVASRSSKSCICEPTSAELNSFFTALSESTVKLDILSVQQLLFPMKQHQLQIQLSFGAIVNCLCLDKLLVVKIITAKSLGHRQNVPKLFLS